MSTFPTRVPGIPVLPFDGRARTSAGDDAISKSHGGGEGYRWTSRLGLTEAALMLDAVLCFTLEP